MKKKFNIINTDQCSTNQLKRACKHGSPVYISQNMTGKMLGVPSISTSVLSNPICEARSKIPGSICEHCFAQNTVSRYSALRDHLEDNYNVLNACDLDDHDIPIINSDICRLESFGDLASVTHAKNFIRIANKSPWCTFALWTKNPALMDHAIQALGKPGNMIIVLSSSHLNTVDTAAYPWIDHIFTVYDSATIARDNIDINCGSRSCRTCMRCYKKGTEFFINEKLK